MTAGSRLVGCADAAPVRASTARAAAKNLCGHDIGVSLLSVSLILCACFFDQSVAVTDQSVAVSLVCAPPPAAARAHEEPARNREAREAGAVSTARPATT